MRGLKGIPVIPSEHAPRESAVVIGRTVVMHPLLMIEIECGDDLNLRSALALAWIQRRAALRASVAMARLDEMFAEAPISPEELDDQVISYLASFSPPRRDEGNYRWPDVEEVDRARA